MPQVSGVCEYDDGNAAGQRCVQAQVASDFYPVSISCGCRVSCAKALGVDGVSRQVGGAIPARA